MRHVLARVAIAAVALAPLALARGPVLAAPRPAFSYHAVCSAAVRPGWARCFALVRTVSAPAPGTAATMADAAPQGYGPADLQSAYKLPSATAGQGQTVAIVDAYDDPNAESDLAHYRAQFGLPACTSASGCFKKVNQYGGSRRLPRADGGWSGEISLDLDMVSAVCPNCHILLVEAFQPSSYDLALGVDTAARLGANAISNSYGGPEARLDRLWDHFYKHAGIAVTASAGDSGYGAQYPAASQYVTAVGGTSLTRDGTTARGWSEAAWSCADPSSCQSNGGTGSGCSRYDAKPSWQTDSACSKRSIADVAAVADPNTGVAVYDTVPAQGQASGWNVFGGTSASSPIIASVYALAGNASSTRYGSYPYSHADAGTLNDITKGSNGACGSYLCNAGPGYDGPTGLGTPNGVGAF